jgi:hypothetical protein
MSSAPLVPDPDLRRLLDDGYDIAILGNHLVVRRIPYVDEQKTIRSGFLAYPITITGDTIASQTDHRIWFGGTHPCDEHGRPLLFANPEIREIDTDLCANFMLSSKPTSGCYTDEYSKVTAYARMLSHPAAAIDPSATATPGAAWQEVDSGQPFAYRDSATSRAGLAGVSDCFKGQRIAIIGLGGTGGYILDQVAKTPVPSILLIDGDTFDNHNAFRAPGAPMLQTLRERPKKVHYFADVYSRMHRGIVTHDVFLVEQNVHLLDGSTFVFLASDDARSKPAIVDWLEEHDIPFIDVGMGIEEVNGHLTGLLRVTTSLPGRRGHARVNGRIPGPAPERDDYDRNIQVADLNALNAVLAVIRWKRHLGFYADVVDEGFATYSLIVNEVSNEDVA